MQIRKIKSILSPTKKNPVRAMAWSANNRRFAVADSTGVVHLFDENGERKDSIPTKSLRGAKGGRSYMISSIMFSPDHTKLAVALCEHLILVYRLGLNWEDKKSICNKFIQKQEGILALCWPFMHPLKLIFGRTDGEVKMAHLQSHKTMRLYKTDSPVQSMTASPDGHGFLSGHFDGSIYRFYFKDPEGEFIDFVGQSKICVHSSIPVSLAWGETIIVGGPDRRVTFYSVDGSVLQQYDYTRFKDEKEFSCISLSPSGQCFIVSSYNRLRVFDFNLATSQWDEGEVLDIPNLHSCASMTWKPDGSRLSVGNINGHVGYFDTCIKRYRYKNQFEFTYVNPSQVIVKMLKTGTRIVLKSLYGCEINKLQTKTKYLIGNTSKTLLLGDLETCKLSEVPWNTTGKERYFFDNPSVCLVYNNTDLSVIEYGINDIIGSFRTEHISPTLISVRIMYNNIFTPGPNGDSHQPVEGEEGYMMEEGVKRVAYLTDSHSIRILDLNSSLAIAKISNPELKIDWLELNYRATKLLYRDKGGNLYLYDIPSQVKKTLLTFCSYVQWVPNSDVVVAQNRGDLCVWYSIDSPDRVTIVSIKGEVENIIRVNNVTAVVVNEGTTTVNYALNEGLIQFGTAMEIKEYETAANILDELALSPETEAMWKNLAELVMLDGKYHIAERCYAAIGDIAKSKFLMSVVKEALRIVQSALKGGKQISLIVAYEHWKIRARIEMLNRNFKVAEQIYLEETKVDEAMEMYESVHKYEESIELAFKVEIPNAAEKKKKYMDWLIQTQQRSKAAKMFEKEGKLTHAIDQYIKGGFPASAARIVFKHSFDGGTHTFHPKVLDKIADKLVATALFEIAGLFYEKRQLFERSLECYRKGHCFRNAVELASKRFEDQVVNLEEEWGDWLVSIKQTEGAINHFIEAKRFQKAMDSAISSRQWTKAQHIIESLDENVVDQYYIRIAKHYEHVKNYEKAQTFFVKAKQHEYCMKMFRNAGMLEEALEVAKMYMTGEEIQNLYVEEAEKMEKRGDFDEAERLFIKGGKSDLAIHMYSRNHMFEDMIRLVEKYSHEHLNNALEQIAMHLEADKKFIEAEKYLVRAGLWGKAMKMYKKHEKWEQAIRVAKIHGGSEDWKAVCVQWATLIGGEDGGKDLKKYEDGAKLLFKYELYEESIDYALEREMFNFAFDIARTSYREKLPDVHREYAVFLEDAGRLPEAEEEYSQAGCPREAVEMYIHRTKWQDAVRVANSHMMVDPTLVNYVHEAKRAWEMQLPSRKDGGASKEGEFKFNIKAKGSGSQPSSPSSSSPKPSVAVGLWAEILEKCKNGAWTDATNIVDELDDDSDIRRMFSALYVEKLIKEKQYDKIPNVLLKYGMNVEEETMPLYFKLVKHVLWKINLNTNELKKMKKVFYELEKKLGKLKKEGNEDLEKWIVVLQLQFAMMQQGKNGLKNLHTKTCVSMVRYSDMVRPDRVYYDAGLKAVDKGWEFEKEGQKLKTLFWNRLLDVYDMNDEIDDDKKESQIKKGELVVTVQPLDNQNFKGTDIPYEIPIPVTMVVTEKKKEEVQEWILGQVYEEEDMESDVKYPVVKCESCSRDMYFASLQCNHCHKVYPPCVITGFPVFSKDEVACRNCERKANKDDWNTWITKMENCPYCDELQLTV